MVTGTAFNSILFHFIFFFTVRACGTNLFIHLLIYFMFIHFTYYYLYGCLFSVFACFRYSQEIVHPLSIKCSYNTTFRLTFPKLPFRRPVTRRNYITLPTQTANGLPKASRILPQKQSWSPDIQTTARKVKLLPLPATGR